MDNTTQFVLIAKHILRELKSLSVSLDGLSQRIDAIRNQESTERKERERQQYLDSIRFEERIQKSKQRQETSRYNLRDWIQVLLVIVTWAAFIAAFTYAGVALLQWSANEKAANAAKSAADTAHTALIEGERPWVGLDGPIKITGLYFGPPNIEIQYTYHIKNFGKTPALKVIAIMHFAASAEKDKFWGDHACEQSVPFTTGTVKGPPGKEYPPIGKILFPGQVLEDGAKPPITDGDIFTPNIKTVWFIGCVSYVDQFKNVYWTRFCQRTPHYPPASFTINMPLEPCNSYNDTNDTQQTH